MPKNRPAVGDQNWGDTLNANLNQISPVGGGINFGTTAQRPTLTAGDDGYTFFDTTTKQVVRWSGTSWEPILTGTPNNEPPAITINGRTVNNLTLASNGTALTDTNGNLTLNFQTGGSVTGGSRLAVGSIVKGRIIRLEEIGGANGTGTQIGNIRFVYSGPSGVSKTQVRNNFTTQTLISVGEYLQDGQYLTDSIRFDLLNIEFSQDIILVEIVDGLVDNSGILSV